MDAGTYIAAGTGLVGVVLGGLMTSLTQRRTHDVTIRLELLRSRESACVDLLSAVRRYRRFLMYSDPAIEEIAATSDSKGTVIVAGRIEYDALVDEAYARILIVARSDKIVAAAKELTTHLNEFVRIRARYGKGMIPNEVIRNSREAEESFASLVRTELDRVPIA